MRPPEHQHPIDTGPARWFVLRLVVILVLLIAGLQSITFYVDSLWFESLGYEPVYWYRLTAQALTFAVFGLATTIVLWLLFRTVTPKSGSRRPFIEVGGETLIIPSSETFRRLALPVAAAFGIFFGLAYSTNWEEFALYLNQPENAGIVDPIFGQPIAFYFFTLPVLQSLASWFSGIAFITLVASVLLSFTSMSSRFTAVSIGLSLFLASAAFQTYLGRYALTTEPHELFTGVQYVGHHVMAPGLLAVTIALLIGAVIAAINVRSGRVRNMVIAIALPAVVFVVAGVLIRGYVDNFVVRPNELARETPYINQSIEFTRAAFGLDQVEEIPFEPRVTNTRFDPAEHSETLDNIRLWDWQALQSTLRQIQEIRTYYDFADVDIDRYQVNGKTQSMMLAVRELNLDKLPAGTRNWLNERLIFTHGYGVTMNPVSQFTNEGQPRLILSNMPVQSTVPEIQVTRPEVYFGEIANWPVYVKTRQQEFNFPEGESNNFSTYEGTGGIPMGSFFRRLLLAWHVGDLARVPFSDDITSESALMIRRNIQERVTTLAPFLHFDEDPYIVVGEDGRLYWMMDAFTMSADYPFSRHLVVNNERVNYIRNSVKAVVDAYNGTVDFYVFDPGDLIIQAYQNVFPDLFRPAAEMPEFLQSHVRYPELFFQIQAMMYATYHVENAQAFYNREDLWTIAQQSRGQSGQSGSGTIEPFYILMKFPGETELEFVSILPFTPANRNNLIGWMAARSDGEAYGKLRAYHFPKTRFIDGPLQVQARIDQEPQLSSQLTLWNQQGSSVIRGNLLVLPLGDTLLFAEPMYLQAERSPMPELRLVVLATQDRLAYAERFPAALQNLLQQPGRQEDITTSADTSPATAASAAAPPAATAPSGQPAPGQSWIDRANAALADYQRLTAEGRLGEAGLKLDELKRVLEEANRSRPPQN